MTEEEFKKAMGKIICFVIIALVILIIIGILVFNTSGKSTSIFGNKEDLENYKKKVEEVNSYNITENITKEDITEGNITEETNTEGNTTEENIEN